MLHIILFEDSPTADPNIRSRHMQEHLAFLERNSTCIQAAGPLLDADGALKGGLWLVDVSVASEADRLVRQDPFWTTGLRLSYSVLRWKQVFAGGRRLTDTG